MTESASSSAESSLEDANNLDVSVGQKIRALRLARGMSLKDVAKKSNLSMGYLSQAERGLSSPSLRVLASLSEVFSVSIASFFPEPTTLSNPDAPVIRKNQRPAHIFWGSGITKEVLTPSNNLEGVELIIYMMAIEPDGSSGDETFTHEGFEAGFVLEGSLELQVGEEIFILEQGDGFRFSSSTPHRFLNNTRRLAQVIWVNYRKKDILSDA